MTGSWGAWGRAALPPAMVLFGGGGAVLAAVNGGHAALIAAVVVSMVVRLQSPVESWRRVGGVAVVLSVAATIGAVGTPTGPLLGVLLVVVADQARREHSEWVLAVALAADAVAVVSAVTIGSAVPELAWVWPLSLVPLVGLAAARLLRVERDMEAAGLESVTAALDEVLALAERMPAGFDRWSVAIAVHEEARAVARAAGAGTSDLPVVLLCAEDLLLGVGNPIARRPVGLVADIPAHGRQLWVAVRRDDFPTGLAAVLEGDRWLAHRLGQDEVHGVVLVPATVSEAVRVAITDVLRPATVALANVSRFERLEEHALSAARVRLAHDLHDGVAQALTHVRFELDLLGLERPDCRQDAHRIRGVADAALTEVRRTVDELRESVPLADRLQRHVELLRTFAATEIELDVSTPVALPPSHADEVFRIAQEALSNVLRHSGASLVRVSVTSDASGISMVVVDDGRGLAPSMSDGVGMAAMHSRARRLGGSLEHRPRRGGGTVVALDAPRPPTGPHGESVVRNEARSPV